MLPKPKSRAEISAEMSLFSIRSFSVLLDDTTDREMLRSIPDGDIKGFYTFTAAAAGRRVRDHEIQLLPSVGNLPESQAWLIATNSKAGYALNQVLRERGREGEIIFTLAKEHVSHMYSYVDFLHGETASIAYISNTFERGYKIHLPVAVRFLLRSGNGKICRSGQWLIAPSHTVALDSRELGLTEPFAGYLELYADIRHLNGEVTEFLHFHCDYLSASGVTTIHQSGYKPWPAGTHFVRGLVPSDRNSHLTTSLFNKSNERPIVCTAILRYTKGGQRLTVAKELSPIKKDHLVFVDINDLFAEELTGGAGNADIVIVPDAPMHRPNFYHHPRASRWSWTAVEHGAGSDEQLLPPEKLRDIAKLGAHPWICIFPILPNTFQLDTSIFCLEDNGAGLHDFTFEIHDETGKRLLEEHIYCEFGQCIDIADLVGRKALPLERGGLLKISPYQARAPLVPKSCGFLLGIKGRANHGGPSLVICGGGALNLPFEWERSHTWAHPALPIVHTEQFGKAIVSDEFETVVTLINASAMYRYDSAADVELSVYAPDGRMATFSKTIPPNSTITFSIGDLLKDSALPQKGHFTLWIYCRTHFVQGFHILKRRRDDAVAAQHFYYSRFNIPERDLPFQHEMAKTFHRHTGRRAARAMFSAVKAARNALAKFL
jgi:hypothetical protein